MIVINYFKQLFKDNLKLADALFTFIILFVSISSFFHVVSYWSLTNKPPFHIFTSIATELIIIGSMVGMKYTKICFWPFALGIIVQSIGNIFYSYMSINVDTELFKGFCEIFNPIFELGYGDELEVMNYKRVLATTNGLFYLSPIIFLLAKNSLENKRKLLAEKKLQINSTPEPIVPPAPASEPEPIVPPAPASEPEPIVPPAPASEPEPIVPPAPASEPEPIVPPASEPEPIVPPAPASEPEPIVPPAPPASEPEPIVPPAPPASEPEPIVPPAPPASEPEKKNYLI